ncbi:AT-hook motif nuclear-localized protein 26 [Forsythia ovata]|uniref:AT-hook motif nuclear-localized protein 26 n=1 Tax=Forsythia ovata TaxID=205694 RepID=A0ABD1TMZ0_9LAMI
MDQLTAQGHPLPHPFHARDLQLHHHPFQHRQQNLEDEQNKNSNINRSLKRNWDENYSVSTVVAEGKELLPATEEGEMTRRPKPHIIITRDSANALKSHVMEVADDCDIQESVSTFATRW